MIALLIMSAIAEPVQDINVTYKNASLPDGWLDSFFSNGDEERPTLKTESFGLEYARTKDKTTWVLYYEYIQNKTKSGYWDDLEEPLDRSDGVWVKPVDVNMHTLGFQSVFNINIPVQQEKLTINALIGGGLGIGILTGSIERWHNGATDYAQNNNNCVPFGDAIVREALCGNNPDVDGLPIPVLPVLDLSTGVQVRYDRFSTKIMFGIHNLPYVGFSLGYAL